MLYLIGGPPRMGKSTMAQKFLSDLGIPYVSTDALTVMLKPVGQPSFYSSEKSERFSPYLDLFISRIVPIGPDYVIEGDAFSPEHVDRLRSKYELLSVFLTMPGITAKSIIENVKYDAWSNAISDKQLENLVVRIQQASISIQADCKRLDIGCFDLSQNYEHEFLTAYESLIKEC